MGEVIVRCAKDTGQSVLFPVRGRNIQLRLATVDDAEFILSLRTDARLNQFISRVSDNVDVQREWLRLYKTREGKGQEYYLIIELAEGRPVGTLRIYDLRADSFCWGSWLILPDAPSFVAIESALLVYEIGFYRLGFNNSHFDVRRANERVVAFHQRLGAKIDRTSDIDHFFTYKRIDYERIKARYAKFLPSADM